MPAAVFTEKQLAIIRDLLDEFRHAPKSAKQDVIRSASRAVAEVTPNSDKQQRKEIRKVGNENEYFSMLIENIIERKTMALQ